MPPPTLLMHCFADYVAFAWLNVIMQSRGVVVGRFMMMKREYVGVGEEVD